MRESALRWLPEWGRSEVHVLCLAPDAIFHTPNEDLHLSVASHFCVEHSRNFVIGICGRVVCCPEWGEGGSVSRVLRHLCLCARLLRLGMRYAGFCSLAERADVESDCVAHARVACSGGDGCIAGSDTVLEGMGWGAPPVMLSSLRRGQCRRWDDFELRKRLRQLSVPRRVSLPILLLLFLLYFLISSLISAPRLSHSQKCLDERLAVWKALESDYAVAISRHSLGFTGNGSVLVLLLITFTVFRLISAFEGIFVIAWVQELLRWMDSVGENIFA